MNDSRFLPDDPSLTAYALGELDPTEAAAIEAALQSDPVARDTVASIRATAARLEVALQDEAIPAGAPAHLVEAAPQRDPFDYHRQPKRQGWAKIVRFPQFYYVISGAAAAVFTVMVLWEKPQRDEKVRAETAYWQLTQERRARAITEAQNGALRDRLALLEAQGGGTMAVTSPAVDLAASAPVTFSVTTAPAPAPSNAIDTNSGLSLLNQTKKDGIAAAADNRFPVGAMAGGGGAATLALANSPAGPIPGSPNGNSPILLSPFNVKADSDVGFVGASSLAGGRIALSSNPGTASAGRGRFDLIARAGSFTRRNLDDVAPRGLRPETVGPDGRTAANTESYAFQRDNDFVGVLQNPYSTFSIDVDTASYANVRRFLLSGRLPPADAVRIEELVNYFPYRYPAPATNGRNREATAPFAASMEVADAPWAPAHRLVRIGLKGREVTTESRPAANLVFLLDVSGSMNAENKLPLVKESMRLLVGKLRADDRVAIVTYAGRSGLALPSTPVSKSAEILAALDALTPGGSTNGAMGIHLAYDIAKANFIGAGVNRVVLCTDGDFNVGTTSEGELVRLIEEKSRSGVFLTVLGFGMGNLKDATLEKLADKGNGNYGYIDTRREAEKMLVEQVNGTLVTIAKDVKIQVEFNPAKVASYRLIGFENRLLAKEDFNNDQVDAGEIGAGHTVTALYEVVPLGVEDDTSDHSDVDDLKYQGVPVIPKLPPAVAGELLTVKVRYKEPAADESKKLEFPLTDTGGRFWAASADLKFAAAVAQFGMQLKNSPHKGVASLANVVEWAIAGVADDPGGFRREFVDLARRAEGLLQ